MLDILHAIKKVIEKYIVNVVSLSANANAGDTEVYVENTRRFNVGDIIAIYSLVGSHSQPEGDIRNVTQVCDDRLVFSIPLSSAYTTNSYVEKMIGVEEGKATMLRSIYIGEPDVIPRFPAITINGRSRSSEWLTLESTNETYDIDITVYTIAADYEAKLELMYYYAKAIEQSLFRSLYPLVEPYNITQFAEDVDPSDTTVKVVDPDAFVCKGVSWVFLESSLYLRPNQITGDLGNGYLKLQFPAGASFSAGDSLIQPLRHMWRALPKGTTYGTVSKGTMLAAAVISYTVEEEVWRHNVYKDPLTF